MNRPRVVYFPSGPLVYFPSGARKRTRERYLPIRKTYAAKGLTLRWLW